MLLIIIKFLLSFHLWIHLKSGIAPTFLIKFRLRNILHISNGYSCWETYLNFLGWAFLFLSKLTTEIANTAVECEFHAWRFCWHYS
jgi:hypothetical protein